MRRQRTVLGAYVRRVRSQSLSRTVRDVADPSTIARHARRLFIGEVVRTNPYTPSLSRDAEARFAAKLIGYDEATVQRAFAELEADRASGQPGDFMGGLTAASRRERTCSGDPGPE